MNSKVFAVYDSKAGAFMAPFFMQTVGMALRIFVDAAKDKETNIGRNPGDYTLFEFGSFDDNSGKFVLLATPVSLGLAVSFLGEADAMPEVPRNVELFPNGSRAPNGQGV